MKILALSDYGNTGISESLRSPLIHWHNQGHEIWHLAVGFNGWTQIADPKCYPYRDRLLRIEGDDSTATRFGQASLHKAVAVAQPDVVISAFDVWMVNYLANPEKDNVVRGMPGALDILDRDKRSFNHIAYFPLDGLVEDKHLPRMLDEMIAGFDVPVTYSQYAQSAVLRDMGMEIPFIPICHDPKIYRPGSRHKARSAVNLPQDKFIVGMVATNQYRKLWGEFIEAAARLARKYEDVLILPWTTWDMQIHGGFDIADLIYRNNVTHQTISPGGMVGQLTDDGMANLYRALDVLVLTTVGEGAGLPPIRARACGVPALVSDNTSNTEFMGHDFEKLNSRIVRHDNGSNIARFATDTDQLFRKLERLYLDRKFRDEVGAVGAEAMLQYGEDKILPVWDALLEMCK